MSEDSTGRRLRAAERIAREAGARALELQRRRDTLAVATKTHGVYDIATEADRAVEALVRERLLAEFPRDGFLGEESAATPTPGDGARTWVVDPIDGTDCFVAGIPAWCVSIALAGEGTVELGVVYDPVHDELFAARAGAAATLNGAAIAVSAARSLAEGVVGVGINHRVAAQHTLDVMGRLLAAGGMYQRNGSGALMLCYVACGRLLGYYEHHINAWDALAGIALVRAAGGWCSDFLAGDGLRRGNELLACAPQLAEPLRALCAPAP